MCFCRECPSIRHPTQNVSAYLSQLPRNRNRFLVSRVRLKDNFAPCYRFLAPIRDFSYYSIFDSIPTFKDRIQSED